NAWHRSETKHVPPSMEVHSTKNDALIIMREDGRDFPPPVQLCQLTQAGRHGLANIGEHADRIDGWPNLQPRPSKDTRVIIHIPLGRGEGEL
ncbi:MAG: hypothetical protein OEZ02_07140, partial [Anaerolineae bacterium]|nr:hypothetical protein [Anaerolineae bacterium]